MNVARFLVFVVFVHSTKHFFVPKTMEEENAHALVGIFLAPKKQKGRPVPDLNEQNVGQGGVIG